jgi:hypothetical protein
VLSRPTRGTTFSPSSLPDLSGLTTAARGCDEVNAPNDAALSGVWGQTIKQITYNWNKMNKNVMQRHIN